MSTTRRVLTWTIAAILVAAIAFGVVWYLSPHTIQTVAGHSTTEEAEPEDVWLDHLFSQNPTDAAAAATWVEQIGEDALPVILETLRSAQEDRERKKAALKACGILGRTARPALADVRIYLLQEDLTAYAAAALSFMGPDALAPLVDGLASAFPSVRRESLRSIGKLRERGPVEPDAVVPLLIGGMSDADPSVRAIAATYLGIIHDRADESIPALLTGLEDVDPAVRLAAANALGEFGMTANHASAALKKASGDKDPEVAREAGRALVNVSASLTVPAPEGDRAAPVRR